MDKKFDSLCILCKKNKEILILPGSLEAMQIWALLDSFSKNIEKNINLNSCSIHLSKGSGTFPKVPWVGISIKGKSVSNSLSVVSCFASDGAGMVCGLMAPVGLSVKKNLIQRTQFEKFINVNGPSSKGKYNNRFVNPVEFYHGNFNENIYMTHLAASVSMLEEHYLNI